MAVPARRGEFRQGFPLTFLSAGARSEWPGSRWSARSEARTNDLDPGGERRTMAQQKGH